MLILLRGKAFSLNTVYSLCLREKHRDKRDISLVCELQTTKQQLVRTVFEGNISLGGCGGPVRTGLVGFGRQANDLLAAGVLGHSLGSLRHSVLGQLTREQETDSGLDFTAGDGGAVVVVGQTGGLSSNTLKDVVDKAVHDGHGLAGDTSVGVHLLQHLVDVDGVRLPPPPLPLLVPGTGGLSLGGGLLGSFA